MLRLVTGNKNYSSWSMRGWLLLKIANLDFEETVISFHDGWRDIARDLGGQSAKLPFLMDDEFAIWDTWAIAEYCHDVSSRIWPSNLLERARARSLAAEMHSGFLGLRAAMPCNIRARDRRPSSDPRVDTDVARIDEIWSAAKGPWLCGQFTGADIFFAPVATRFRTYGVNVSPAARGYSERLLSHPLVVEYAHTCLSEPAELQYELPPR